MMSTKAAGHSTLLKFRSGFPLRWIGTTSEVRERAQRVRVRGRAILGDDAAHRAGTHLRQPQAEKSTHPLWNSSGNALHSPAAVSTDWWRVYQSPSLYDECDSLRASASCGSQPPVALRLPQTFAVEYSKLSKPGTAMSMCRLGSSHPELQGGQRFFFITIAVQVDWTASGFWTSTHLPQAALPVSVPQQPSSAPSNVARASEAAPVIHNTSPCDDAPPCAEGSRGW